MGGYGPPSNSPALAPSDLEHFIGKQFATDADFKQPVTFWLQEVGTDFLCVGIQA
jgi:hypothetical protein